MEDPRRIDMAFIAPIAEALAGGEAAGAAAGGEAAGGGGLMSRLGGALRRAPISKPQNEPRQQNFIAGASAGGGDIFAGSNYHPF